MPRSRPGGPCGRSAAKALSTAAPAGAGDGCQYDIAKASVDGVGIALKDRSLTRASSYDLRIESATAQHPANVGKAPVRFEATLLARPRAAPCTPKEALPPTAQTLRPAFRPTSLRWHRSGLGEARRDRQRPLPVSR